MWQGFSRRPGMHFLSTFKRRAGRFQNWSELASYDMPGYQISLTRYYGFGIEETDFNAFGPNLEFDGFGLFLWALNHYSRHSDDYSLAEDNWTTIRDQIADPLVQLVDPTTGLIRKGLFDLGVPLEWSGAPLDLY